MPDVCRSIGTIQHRGQATGALAMLTTIPTSSLCAGAVLGSPIHDQQLNTKLLAAGIPIDEELLHKLKRRGVHTVVVDQADVARLNLLRPQGTVRVAPPPRKGIRSELENVQSRQLDEIAERKESLHLLPADDPFCSRILEHGSCPYDPEALQRLTRHHEQSLDYLKALYAALAGEQSSGPPPAFDGLTDCCNESLNRAAEDMDLFVCLGINPFAEGYPHRHSLHTAMLAMGIGAAADLDREAIIELGIGCLLHDCGMLKMRRSIYETERVLDESEFKAIAQHPVLIFEMLGEHLDKVPAGARMVAYQMHERCNGSGYPRGRTDDQIHDLAKISAVADAYVALVSPRPHRRGLLPYFALEKILHGVRDGLFDGQAARGLVNCISLFPIGSYVAASDDRIGRVIRANRGHFDRPIIELWPRQDLDTPPALVDLSIEQELKIVRPLARLR